MFQGFSEVTNEFLWGIRLNNSREWFQPRKQIYIDHVYSPLKELACLVQEEMLRFYPQEEFNCKVTRIYRDARIPHPDGPYKTSLWFSLEAPRDPDIHPAAPNLFFEIQGGRFATGMDFYCNTPSVMETFRTRALENPAALEELTLYLRERPEYQLLGPEYKRSKGEVGPLLAPWFNRKRLYLINSRDWDSEILSSETLVKLVTDDFQWLMPFYRYFSGL